MRSRWQALHAKLIRSTHTLAFQREFEQLRQAAPDLARFTDPAALFDVLHTVQGDPDHRNRILVALVRAAQTDRAPSATATMLLILGLWPGLDAVQHRLAHHFRADPDELVAEISERINRGIRTLRLDRVNRIAATLLRNLERDIRRNLRAKRRQAALSSAYSRHMYRAGTLDQGSPFALPCGADFDTTAALLEQRLRQSVRADAALVVAIAVHGDRQHEVAERLGVGHEAARKRYQRAVRRLRQEFQSAA